MRMKIFNLSHTGSDWEVLGREVRRTKAKEMVDRSEAEQLEGSGELYRSAGCRQGMGE